MLQRLRVSAACIGSSSIPRHQGRLHEHVRSNTMRRLNQRSAYSPGSSALRRAKQPTETPHRQRSGFELATWLFAFPVLGGVILGVVGRRAYQHAGTLAGREWFSIGLALFLGVVAVTLPPIIAMRELRRRKLEREDEEI